MLSQTGPIQRCKGLLRKRSRVASSLICATLRRICLNSESLTSINTSVVFRDPHKLTINGPHTMCPAQGPHSAMDSIMSDCCTCTCFVQLTDELMKIDHPPTNSLTLSIFCYCCCYLNIFVIIIVRFRNYDSCNLIGGSLI